DSATAGSVYGNRSAAPPQGYTNDSAGRYGAAAGVSQVASGAAHGYGESSRYQRGPSAESATAAQNSQNAYRPVSSYAPSAGPQHAPYQSGYANRSPAPSPQPSVSEPLSHAQATD